MAYCVELSQRRWWRRRRRRKREVEGGESTNPPSFAEQLNDTRSMHSTTWVRLACDSREVEDCPKGLSTSYPVEAFNSPECSIVICSTPTRYTLSNAMSLSNCLSFDTCHLYIYPSFSGPQIAFPAFTFSAHPRKPSAAVDGIPVGCSRSTSTSPRTRPPVCASSSSLVRCSHELH